MSEPRKLTRSSVVGDNLRRFRAKREFTQDELARVSGVSKPTICEIETGTRPNPRMSSLTPLAKALRVEVADFFREPGERAS